MKYFVLCIFMLSIFTSAEGVMLLEHKGTTNPEQEGLTLKTSNLEGLSTSAKDGGWCVTDNNSKGGCYYQYSFNDKEKNLLKDPSKGFIMRMEVKLIEGSTYFKVEVNTAPGKRQGPMYIVKLVVIGNQVRAQIGNRATPYSNEYTMVDHADKYHLYELYADPKTPQADLYVDGVKRIENVGVRYDSGIHEAFFGAASGPDNGTACFKLVQVEALTDRPESITNTSRSIKSFTGYKECPENATTSLCTLNCGNGVGGTVRITVYGNVHGDGGSISVGYKEYIVTNPHKSPPVVKRICDYKSNKRIGSMTHVNDIVAEVVGNFVVFKAVVGNNGTKQYLKLNYLLEIRGHVTYMRFYPE
ncbi:hypothetical protein [Candidatus Uabimicrobium amorphum]|uniref:Uncharacterized protein n=1 Tax=Uabimicrobium amorphum TaxID=2596890 RepID=A0A5S9IRC0_UABAM|nr:hypothetical protein [Candidatus Uabimicrobium amorphum]BBM86206.1 hypothetical protein UABAM_04592 [Candidatus Uabimicrobium amorphum]